mgnify:CR=1 FL=1|jgi:hypothetical protein
MKKNNATIAAEKPKENVQKVTSEDKKKAQETIKTL